MKHRSPFRPATWALAFLLGFSVASFAQAPPVVAPGAIRPSAGDAAVARALATLREATDERTVSVTLDDLRRRADRGSREASWRYGEIRAAGAYVDRDAKVAEDYLRRAARKGLPEAQHALAMLLLSSPAVPSRRTEALDLLQRAGKSLPESVYALALQRARDAADAEVAQARVIATAAQAGWAEAQYQVGATLLQQPPDPERDRAAFDWLQRAAEQGHVAANASLGTLLLEGGRGTADPARALPLLERAAAGGDARAEYTLGRAFLTGRGVAPDTARGIALTRRAAVKRLPEAEYALGYAYTEGIGVGVDEVQAFGWFQRAASHGYGQAMFALGNAYANGYGVGKSERHADVWYCKAVRAGFAAAIALMQERGSACR